MVIDFLFWYAPHLLLPQHTKKRTEKANFYILK